MYAVGVGGSILIALVILGSQAIAWAKTGHWSPMPLGEVLHHLGVDLRWPYAASDWIGLANATRMALQVHVSVFVGIGGALLAWAIGAMFEGAATKRKQRRPQPTNPRARQQ